MAEEIQQDVTPKKPAEIIRGRMPVTCVFLVRFDFNTDDAKSVAIKFGTTIGKINDIRKNSNFKYVEDWFLPTLVQKAEAIAWLKRHPEYDVQNVDKIVTMIDNMPVATPEIEKRFAEMAKMNRAQPVTTKTGEIADGGGGNRIKPKKTEEIEETKSEVEAPTDEELLA